MRRLMLWIVRHPIPTTAFVVIATVAFATQLTKLTVDTSVKALMLADDPDRVYHEEVKESFGSDDLTIVVVKAPDVFTAPVLQLVDRLSESLDQLDGVERVDSLTTVNNLKGEGDWLNTSPLIDGAIPDDPQELARIREDALGNPILVGNLVATATSTVAIAIAHRTIRSAFRMISSVRRAIRLANLGCHR